MSTELNDLLNEARELENADSSDYTTADGYPPQPRQSQNPYRAAHRRRNGPAPRRRHRTRPTRICSRPRSHRPRTEDDEATAPAH